MITSREIFKCHLLSLILLAIGGFVNISCSSKKPSSEVFEFHTTLHVGDELSCFSLNDVLDSDYGINWTYGDTALWNRTIPPHIFFKARVDLRNGFRYICTNSDGCIVKLEGCIITQGTIKVYKKKDKL